MLPDVASLQLLFAYLNSRFFGGTIPAYKIAYNARFSNVAGRIMYKPPLIELSAKHFERHPEGLRDTLLHEMIHAWLHARKENSGHTPAFKKKMREVGLRSIYHDMGRIPRKNERPVRYVLRCERCTLELPRKRRPPAEVSCGRCSPRRYDSRFRMRLLEAGERGGQASGRAAS